MKKFYKNPITSSSLSDEFMKYHDSPINHQNNSDGFNKMYDILQKYGDEDEDVVEVFNRATEDDQKRMIELIRPNKRGPITISELSDRFYNLQIKDEKGITSQYEDGYIDGISDCLEAFRLSL